MQMASWVFVSLLIVFLLAIVGFREWAPRNRGVDANTHMILGFLCALLAGLAAFFMIGDIGVSIAPERIGIGVQATGGFGLFVFVMWWWRTFPLIPVPAAPATPVQTAARTFGMADELYPQIKAVARNQSVTPVDYRISSRFEDGDLFFVEKAPPGTGPLVIEKVTPDDFKNLGPEAAEDLRVLKESLDNVDGEWKRIFPRRGLDPMVDKRLRELAKVFCQDFEKMLQYLGGKHAVLDDHYARMRQVCRDLSSPG